MNNYPISDFIVSDPDTRQLLDEFEKKIQYDHPSTPCAYCSILMMSTAAKWVDYDPDETYDLTTAFPKLQLPLRMNNQDRIKIAVCSSCKTVKNHHFPPVLAAIPEEINVVPMVLHRTIKE
ncbi:4853_t:CDS:2 [Entrophospora sp. SA101]|nr:4853_t:CDS:2 [Entrophospora sp. SA101]